MVPEHLFCSYPDTFNLLKSFLSLSDTSENPLPPNLVSGGAKMGPKRGNMGKLPLTSKVLVIKRSFLFLPHHFLPSWIHFLHFQIPLKIRCPQIGTLVVPKWVIWVNVL